MINITAQDWHLKKLNERVMVKAIFPFQENEHKES
jgi:hypothetical protein